MISYEGFGVENNKFNNTKLAGVSDSDYSTKILNDQVLGVIATLMNSVGRKDNLTEADVTTSNNPKTWDDYKTSDTTNMTTDVTAANLKEASKWTPGTNDIEDEGTIPTNLQNDGAGGTLQLGTSINTQDKPNRDLFFKHNGVVWKWNQQKLANTYVITLKTVKGHSPMFYKSTTTSTKATTNHVVLFGNKTTTKATSITEVQIELNISYNLQ